MKACASLLLVVAFGSTVAVATQDVADSWTTIQFTLPIPAPYGEATVTARTTGEAREMRIAELTISYGKNKLAVPAHLLRRLASPDLSSMNLYHPPRPFDGHFYLTLRLKFGDPSHVEPFDFPEASFSIVDGRLVELSVTDDMPEAERKKIQWTSDGN